MSISRTGINITSTDEALTYLYSVSLDASRFRFRGQADFDWTLKPSVHREFQRYQTVRYEGFILEAKPKKRQPPLTHTTFDLEWLMLCQHYGVPTRLLDWSSDILVSLFFACEDEKHIDVDGALFVCNQNDYPMFAAYNEEAMKTQDLAFISTNIVNPRMRTQSGSFIFWGHAPLPGFTESYDLWEYQQAQDNSHHLVKICVPRHAKKIILEELKNIYSITHDTLFTYDGYLEKNYASDFKILKENARLMTLYVTDADSLTTAEEKRARAMFSIECRNMIGNCVNIRQITQSA